MTTGLQEGGMMGGGGWGEVDNFTFKLHVVVLNELSFLLFTFV